MKRIRNLLPAISLDISGVLKAGKIPIEGAMEVLNLLTTPLCKLNSSKFGNMNFHLPFVLLSNGGGVLEEDKAEELNDFFMLENNHRLSKEHIILSNTPFKEMVNLYPSKNVLLCGSGNISKIAESYGYKDSITLAEYSSLFPHLCLLANKGRGFQKAEILKESALKKLHQNDIPTVFPQIKAIFLMSTPTIWEENIQLISDFLISKDGIPGMTRAKNEPQLVKLYISNNDLTYWDNFPIPRISGGVFMLCLKEFYHKLYDQDFEYIQFGKPSIHTFKFAEKHLKRNLDYQTQTQEPIEISRFYMIGDNPSSDIKGSNDSGWFSILVKTGIFKGKDNDPINKAHKVFNNCLEAIKWIISEEKIIY